MSAIDLTPANLSPAMGFPSVAHHDGKDAVRLVLTPDAITPDNPTFARLKDIAFLDGIIEVEVAGRPLPDAAPDARGFIGIAFRIQEDLSKFECFYSDRPTAGPRCSSGAIGHANTFPIPIGSSIACAGKCPAITRRMSIL